MTLTFGINVFCDDVLLRIRCPFGLLEYSYQKNPISIRPIDCVDRKTDMDILKLAGLSGTLQKCLCDW